MTIPAQVRDNSRVQKRGVNPNQALIARLDERLRAVGLSDRAAAMKATLGIDTIRNIRRGREPRLSALRALAPVLGCTVGYLTGDEEHVGSEEIATGLGEAPAPFDAAPVGRVVDVDGEPYASLVRWDMRLSAGPGTVAPGAPEAQHRMLFRLEWIKRVTATPIEHLVVLDVDGDSMEPTLRTGDNVLVDLRQKAPGRKDGLYALNRDGELQVKRVSAHPVTGLLTVASDNPAYRTWPDIAPGDVDVVGRVIWIGRAL